MDAFRIREFFSSQTMNYQTVAFLLERIHSSLLICNQFCLECLREWFFYHQIRDSVEKSETLIRYPYHNCKEGEYSFENCDWIYVHVDGSVLGEFASLV